MPVRLFIFALQLAAADFNWQVRPGFPLPAVPAGNPMTAAKVELGRHLFYDQRLSVNGKQSCASCHRQDLAFTDGLARAKGTTGVTHQRSSMSLVNVAYSSTLTWANPKLEALEPQALVPMLGIDPVELGLDGLEIKVMKKMRSDATYRKLFPLAFPDTTPTFREVTMALAAFERTIISTRSPYDRYRYGGEPDAISPAAKRGELLFFSSEKAGCFQCHRGWNFSGAIRYAGGPDTHPDFHNTGLYHPYTAPNTGLHQHTGQAADIGKFRAPTLRNIAVTTPTCTTAALRLCPRCLNTTVPVAGLPEARTRALSFAASP